MAIDDEDNDFNMKKPGQEKPKLKYSRGPISWLLIGLVVLTVLMMFNKMSSLPEISYDKFRQFIIDGDVESLKIGTDEIRGKLNDKGVEGLKDNKYNEFVVVWDKSVSGEQLLEMLDKTNVKYEYVRLQTWLPILINTLLPILLLVFIFYFFIARASKGGGPGGMLMNFGRSKHKVRGKDQSKVTFKDVAGIEEAKEEVTETIEFLKNPKRFRKIGGRIPRGVLLVGPPGCGKTLLAKAIAGEAEVPFFSISGSDFVEMFVGVGASRVRDLFKQAKENSPCIIFLDEIDAIGRKRGPGFVSGGHDEREQTLNAILVEMDGFDTSDQVIVIAATNRADILDHALTRPGRFDRQVTVPLPDINGRVEILKVHSKKVKMNEDTNLEKLARGTPMFSGAELEAIINEAAIAATMANKESVEDEDLEEARDKVRWGRAKKSRQVDIEDKKLTAFHEAGHTLVQAMSKNADPLHKVSIIPRGPMGGATFSLPEKDRHHYTRKYCMAMMQVCFGGRIAEELFCDDISSGAVSDIQQATSIAREMVTNWGMSAELGPINYSNEGTMKEAYFPNSSPEYSEKTAEKIDAEIRKLIDEAYLAARYLITENKEKLKAIAEALLKYETLDASEVKQILDGGDLNKPTVAQLLEQEQQKTEQNNAESKAKADSDEIEKQED
jgi:cell division protease FtsH